MSTSDVLRRANPPHQSWLFNYFSFMSLIWSVLTLMFYIVNTHPFYWVAFLVGSNITILLGAIMVGSKILFDRAIELAEAEE